MVASELTWAQGLLSFSRLTTVDAWHWWTLSVQYQRTELLYSKHYIELKDWQFTDVPVKKHFLAMVLLYLVAGDQLSLFILA